MSAPGVSAGPCAHNVLPTHAWQGSTPLWACPVCPAVWPRGTFVRSFACEVEPGDVFALYPEKGPVTRVTRIDDNRTRIDFADGSAVRYGKAYSTVMVLDMEVSA